MAKQGLQLFVEVVLTMFKPWLKEYYEIVGESRPLSAYFPKHADLLAFLIMKLSNPPSFRAIRALIASQSTFEI